MGYYVKTNEVNVFVDKKHFDDIYKKMCELNDYHELKRGGSFGSNNDNVEDERYPRDKWFSWMAYNYPETCKNIFEILMQLGFEWELDDMRNLINLRYDYNKTGQEEYFLSCFAGYMKSGSYINFKGEEDDDYYKFYFDESSMYQLRGQVEIKYNITEKYDFGKPSKSDLELIAWRKEWNLKQAQKALENN